MDSQPRENCTAGHRSDGKSCLTLINSLHTKLFPVFKRYEAIPLTQNNETKRCTFEIWFAHKEIVNGEDYCNDEGIDFVSYFRILSLKIGHPLWPSG